MDVGLGIAGFICIAMAAGHTAIGVVWVLPSLTEERLPATPFGPPSTTVAMVRVTWFIVTVFVVALGGLLVTLAWSERVDPAAALLRWFAAMWVAATVMAVAVSPRSLRRPRYFFRLPVPLLWVVVAVLCWQASA
ncbi:MAG TPA: hypothetical protein VHI71_05115 [Actinomycetota bacterium]|nr:hypothetical protein [Actinomycetota bacterium]